MSVICGKCLLAAAASEPAHSVCLLRGRLAAQLALFALAGPALVTQQLQPALQATLAALNTKDIACAAAAYMQARMRQHFE